MTREEAIEVLQQDIPCEYDRDLIEALDIAISALSAEVEYIKKSSAKSIILNRPNRREMIQALKSLPTYSFPDREKGEWIFVQRGKNVDVCCGKCKSVRIKDYAYGYSVDEMMEDEDTPKLLASDDMRFCPNCGAVMKKGENE